MAVERTLRYTDTGADIGAHQQVTTRLKSVVEATFHDGVLTRHGAFAGRVRIPGTDLVLVGNIEGVGTKFEVALEMAQEFPELNPFEGLGRDIFAQCVNHSLPAEPFAFMDYIGSSGVSPNVILGVVEGIAAACRESGCALIKGESGAKPKIYQEGRYDCVGALMSLLPINELPNEAGISAGDRILGLGSNGLHSNGFSLFRLVAERAKVAMTDYVPELGCRLGEEGLKPHRLYLNAVRALKQTVKLKGVAHITVGGIPKNLPRILPDGTGAIIYHNEVVNAAQPIFRWMQTKGNVPWEGPGGMIETFNMGIGLMVVVGRRDLDDAFAALRGTGENAFFAGEIVESDERTVEFV